MLGHLPLSGRRVLVVEDEVSLAFELVDELEAAGAVPLGPVPTVTKALELVGTTKRIDAALLDVTLCGRVSFPVADVLLGRDIPFIFITGGDENATDRFPDAPVYLKPAEIGRIVQDLIVLIAERHGR